MYEECWIAAYEKKLSRMPGSLQTCILTPDVRFPNELKAIQEMGGVVIRLTRAPFGDEDRHESETALDEIEQLTMASISDIPPVEQLEGSLLFDAICDNQEMSIEEQEDWTKRWVLKAGVLDV
jgi:hypothetical protein